MPLNRLALNFLRGPTTAQKWAAWSALGPGRSVLQSNPDQLAALGGWTAVARNKTRKIWPDLEVIARRELDRCRLLGIKLIWPGHDDFPEELGQIPDPPVVLYLKGSLRKEQIRLAIVGSRNSSTYGRRVAEDFAATLAIEGIAIVSGGARGIDARAHRAALAAGGATVAVLGSGLERLYPHENARLFEKISRQGALISEFPLDAAPVGWGFLQRNRLISGLSLGVIAVEAAQRSGALSTVHHAAEQGREVFAVPGSIYSETSRGTNALIADGAKMLRNKADLFSELRLPEAPVVPRSTDRTETAGMTTDEQTLYKALSPETALHLDTIADRVCFGVARLQVALYGLLDRETVEELAGRYYILRPRR